MYEFLKKIPLFTGIPDADLERLCEMVEEVRLPAGAQLFAEGSPGARAYVIKEGELEIIKTSGRREVLLAVRVPGEVIGEMSLLERAPRMASVRARTDALLLAIHQEQLDQLLDSSPTAVRAMLHTVLGRLRNTEAQMRQSEKLAELGTLSAGVAHELNNPAAAVRRGSEQLREAVARLGRAQAHLPTLELNAGQQAHLTTLLADVPAVAEDVPLLGALERSEREESVELWLEDRGVDEAWEHAPVLAEMGFEEARLDALLGDFAGDALPAVVSLLAANYAVATLLREVAEGATRISDIVRALKSYVYLDQAPMQAVDVQAGLEDTLLILRAKLKGIEVQRDYEPNLPTIQAYGSELNQVFTNIIDNAIYALGGQGRITIRTRTAGKAVVVEIEDNGPGIPEKILPHIFDPFFTTKPPGHGTGLGLSTSYNIVVEKHRGELEVFSQPGQTVFRLTLPINFEDEDKAEPEPPAPTLAGDDLLRHVLETSQTIAVLGMSRRPEKAAHTVPLYLRDQGYEIMPVNPNGGWLDGLRVYRDLFSLPKVPDVVLVFRPSAEAPEIVEQAIQIGARVVWMQLGIFHEAAAEAAHRAGLTVVMDTCMRRTHQRLYGPRQGP